MAASLSKENILIVENILEEFDNKIKSLSDIEKQLYVNMWDNIPFEECDNEQQSVEIQSTLNKIIFKLFLDPENMGQPLAQWAFESRGYNGNTQIGQFIRDEIKK